MPGHYVFPKYEQHPLAISLMPGGMDEAEFGALCDDVAERGVIYPITIFEGKVLDGWHRYRAAEKSGCTIKEIEYKGKDPAGYITAVNVLRRKLSSLQRALVGARLHRDHNLTQRDVCKKLGISNEAVTLVLRAMDSKNTRILKKIESDSDFTRNMLREELEDSGALSPRQKPETKAGPNSVFDHGVSPSDDDEGLDGDDEEVDSLLGKSKQDTIGNDDPLPTKGKRVVHKERNPKLTNAQVTAMEFKSMMMDEKVSFLQIIWPEAGAICREIKLVIPEITKRKPAKQVVTPEDALAANLGLLPKKAQKAAKK